MRELADRGVPGVLALGLLMVGFMRATFRAADPKRSGGYTRHFLAGAGAASVGWVCVFLTGDHLMYDSVAGMFWYMVALGLAATRHTAQPVAAEKSASSDDVAVHS